MLSKRAKQEFAIMELVAAKFYAVCSSCHKSKTMYGEDADQAACGYYESGWRVKGEELLCPKCKYKGSRTVNSAHSAMKSRV